MSKWILFMGGMLLLIGSVGAVEIDTIGIGQALGQMVGGAILGLIGFVELRNGGVFD